MVKGDVWEVFWRSLLLEVGVIERLLQQIRGDSPADFDLAGKYHQNSSLGTATEVTDAPPTFAERHFFENMKTIQNLEKKWICIIVYYVCKLITK